MSFINHFLYIWRHRGKYEASVALYYSPLSVIINGQSALLLNIIKLSLNLCLLLSCNNYQYFDFFNPRIPPQTMRCVFVFPGVHLPQGLPTAVHPPSHLLLPGITAQMSVWNSQCWGGRLQARCTLQERLTNQVAQTQGLTNRTMDREGRGIKLSTEWD